MARTLDDVLDGLPSERGARVEARADEIHQEYLTLKKLRAHMELTQTALARTMGVAQATIAQLEQRNDIRVSTLRKYVEALGGTLSITVDMPGERPVPLTGLGDRHLADGDDDPEQEVTASPDPRSDPPPMGG